jgi:hypothetical protein
MIGRGLITAMVASGGLVVAGVSADVVPTAPPSHAEARTEARLEVLLDAMIGRPGSTGVADDVDAKGEAGIGASAAAGGMPLAHGLTGEEFGLMVSELARSEPGAVAEHFRELARELAPVTIPDAAASADVAVMVRAGSARPGGAR